MGLRTCAITAAFMMMTGPAIAQNFTPRGPVASVSVGPETLVVSFVATSPTSASLAIQREKAGVAIQLLKTDRDILWVLSDQRLAPLWPAILSWASEDFSRLRTARLKEAEEKFRKPAQPLAWSNMSAKQIADQQVVATQRSYSKYTDYAHALFDAGEVVAAKRILQQGMALPPLESDKGFSAIMMPITLSGMLARLGDSRGAIAILEQAEQRFPLTTYPHAVNLTVNRAQLLAEQGRHSEALAAIDAPNVRAALGKATDRGERIVGGVRACATVGTKRAEEGQRSLKALQKDAIRDPIPYRRALTCLGDGVGLRQSYLERLADPRLFNGDIIDMQPGLALIGPGRTLLADVRKDPAVLASFSARARTLPRSLTPALNGWRE